MQHGKWIPKLPQGFVRPLYGLDLLKIYPESTVLIVEGEKTAEAARLLFPDYVCVTWSGGVNNVKNTDWIPLAGRKIILWPDNDKVGIKAMNKIGIILTEYACNPIEIIDVSIMDKPQGWDLADLGDEDVYSLLLETITTFKIKEDLEYLIKEPKPNRALFPHLNEKGALLNTKENLEHLLKSYKYKIRYNLMTNSIEITHPTIFYDLSNNYNCHMADLVSLCSLNGLPKSEIDRYIEVIAFKNTYHPVRDWIESKSWDGVKRVQSLIETVKCTNHTLRDIFIRKWLIGAVAAVYSQEGMSIHGVLTFQGVQGIGKTSWFKSLAPNDYLKESLTLDANNKDSVVHCTNRWIGELGEVDNTFNRSSIASLKSFITRSLDCYRPPYGRSERQIPRRTVYFASVNDENFLLDKTGNRRWWTLSITELNYQHTIDMQQLWAEVYIMFKNGAEYWLNKQETDLLNDSNKNFEEIDPLEEMFLERFDWNDKFRSEIMTVTQVLEQCGFFKTDFNFHKIAGRAGKIVNKLCGGHYSYSSKIKKYAFPKMIGGGQ